MTPTPVCRYCDTPLDRVWAEIGYDYHVTCIDALQCPHGVERGMRYCPLCRRERNITITTPAMTAIKARKSARRPVEAAVAPVGHNHPGTAKAAAQRVLPASGSKRRMVLDAIRDSGDGLCDWQLERLFGWKHESASACRRSLVADGWLKDSGRTRPVPDTGNRAIVWTIED